MKIFVVIPGTGKGSDMVFARRQADIVEACGAQVSRFFIESRTSPLRIVKEWLRLRSEIKGFNPDVIHCHFGTMTAFMAVCATRRPVVITYRGSDLNPVPSGNYIRTLFGHILSQISAIRACRIICVSHELVGRLWWCRNKAIVIPTGVDTEMFNLMPKAEARACLGWKHNDPVALFNAGFSPRVKRVDLAEMAVAAAQKVNPRIKMVVLRGDVPPNDIPLYINASDVLLLTSDYEGSPTIVQEAIACGLPVVSVAVGDVPERLAGVFPSKIVPKDPALLGAALLDMLALKQRSNGPEIAAREFGNQVLAAKVLEELRTASARTKYF